MRESHEKAHDELRKRGYTTDATFTTKNSVGRNVQIKLYYQPDWKLPSALIVLFPDGDWNLYSNITDSFLERSDKRDVDTWEAFDRAAQEYLRRLDIRAGKQKEE